MDRIQASFQITIARETRWVECQSVDGGRRFQTLEYVALARVGRAGSKLWPSKVNVWLQTDGTYRAGMSTVHLNRQAVIVGWNKAELARYLSNHNSAVQTS